MTVRTRIKKHISNTKGFSLAELIVVIAIVAILAAGVTVSIVTIVDKAAKSLVESELQKYKLAYDAWKADTGEGGSEQSYLNYIDPQNGSANYKITSGIVPTINWSNKTVEVLIKSSRGRINLETGDITFL